jgi:hypothetical protein
MQTLSVTLGTFVDKALIELNAPQEQGFRVVMGTDALGSSTATDFTLVDATGVNVSDVIEFGSELLLITAKSDASTPVFTAARGYYNTTAASSGHENGSIGTVNPQWPRFRVAEAVKRAFTRLDALGLPRIEAAVFNRVTDLQQVAMPSRCKRVLAVRYVSLLTGKPVEVANWRFYPDMPTATFANGNILTIPSVLDNTDDLQVVFTSPYRWSTHPTAPSESSTMTVPEGAEDLPAMYAAAFLVSRREISRSELDRSEEWNRSEPLRQGGGMALARALFQQFYQALDEARRLYPLPIHRPYVPSPR